MEPEKYAEHVLVKLQDCELKAESHAVPQRGSGTRNPRSKGDHRECSRRRSQRFRDQRTLGRIVERSRVLLEWLDIETFNLESQ